MQSEILSAIDKILIERKKESGNESYVASLYEKGIEKILKKVSEESTEVVMAAKDCEHNNSKENQAHLVYEVTDLWFHTLVLLAQQELTSSDVTKELERRFGLSGHTEKANRKK
jgi:phosphoribosyl-ATP pyrophosphohydrolase